MEIQHDDYQVLFNSDENTVLCSGSFRLTGSEYGPIMEILNTVADDQPEFLIMDLTALKFLNSSGINTLCKFVMRLRKNNINKVNVIGSNEFAWQKKSLANFKKLLPSLELEFK